MKNKLLLVGPLPPPQHGQSLSFKMLVDSFLEESSEIKVISIADKKISGKRGFQKTLARIYSYISIIIHYFIYVSTNSCRVYITIAQSRQGFYRDFVMIWIASLFSRPIVVHLKGGNYGGFYSEQSGLLKWIIRKTLLRVERILVLGHKLTSMYDFEPKLKGRIYVVENGLPFDLKPKQTKTINGKIQLLFLSNMVESKGYLDILDALHLLGDMKNQFHINFAGTFYVNSDDDQVTSEEHAKQLFQDKINKLSLEQLVTYHGTVSGQKKIKLLESAHVFLLPTNYNNEGQPVSIIEALAFGIPIIATDYRAITDMVINNITGCLVDYKSPDQIANAIKYICSDQHYQKMSASCLQLYANKFTRVAHIERIRPHITGN